MCFHRFFYFYLSKETGETCDYTNICVNETYQLCGKKLVLNRNIDINTRFVSEL